MDEKFDKAIEVLLSQFKSETSSTKGDDSMKLSQAILNLVHAKQHMLWKPDKPTS